jgi:hypothetical protein
MYTTLNKIRAWSPCYEGWIKLLKYLGKTKADNAPLSLLTILDSNGLDDTLWCFRAVDGYEKEQRLFAVWCARQVQHLMTDSRFIAAIDVAERYANGTATKAELKAARDATWDAAMDAAWDAAMDAAMAAAMAATWDAARNAAMAAATDAVMDAATDAVMDAARAATWDLAWDLARAAQENQLRLMLSQTTN